MKEYYNILGVSSNSSNEDIKKAYRKLSLIHHPDKNGGNDELFKEINEAYSVLSNNNTRKTYDMNNAVNNEINFQHINPNDLFNAFFNNNPNMHFFRNNFNMNQNMIKPNTIIKNIEITIEQAYNGYTLPIEIERLIHKNGTSTSEKDTIYITIPRGIDDNEMIIIQEKGNIIDDINKGDIKIIIKILNNTPFKREGLNLIYHKVLTFKESLCGFSFDLEFLNNKIFRVNNNNGTIISNGYKKQIPNIGFTRNEYTGSLIIEFEVIYPETLTIEQINALNTIL